MAMVVTDAGELKLLQWAFRESLTSDAPLTLKIFSNNVEPAATGITYTEATFTGYTSKTLSRNSWDAPATVSGVGVINYAEQIFTCTGGTAQTVYGYYIVDGSGTVIWAERFDDAYSMTTGMSISVFPKFQLQNDDEAE